MLNTTQTLKRQKLPFVILAAIFIYIMWPSAKHEFNRSTSTFDQQQQMISTQ